MACGVLGAGRRENSVTGGTLPLLAALFGCVGRGCCEHKLLRVYVRSLGQVAGSMPEIAMGRLLGLREVAVGRLQFLGLYGRWPGACCWEKLRGAFSTLLLPCKQA